MKPSLFLLAILVFALCDVGRAGGDAIPVTCGAVITQPGRYYLTGDGTGAGIRIQASDVDLNLAGRTLRMDHPFQVAVALSHVTHVRVHDGCLANVAVGVDLDQTSDCRIDHVRVQYSDTTGDSAFRLVRGVRNRIDNNTVNPGPGLSTTAVYFTGGGDQNTLLNNQVDGGAYSVWMPKDVTRTTISGNTFLNTNNGIFHLSGGGSIITGNTLSGHGIGYGIYLENVPGTTLRDNVLQGFLHGIYVYTGGNNKILHNTVFGNTVDQITLELSSSNRLEGNTVSGGVIGLFLITSSNNWVSRNMSLSNAYGVIVSRNSVGNQLTNNIALNNSEYDLTDYNPTPLLVNLWQNNTFGTSNPPGGLQ